MSPIMSTYGGGVTVYECKICNSKFNTRSAAMEHITIAHPEKVKNEYSCSKCGASFSSEEKAKAHVISKHPELYHRYKCSLCNQTFSSTLEAAQHLANSHAELHLDNKNNNEPKNTQTGTSRTKLWWKFW